MSVPTTTCTCRRISGPDGSVASSTTWAGRAGATLAALACVLACAAPGLLAAVAAGTIAALGGLVGLGAALVAALVTLGVLVTLRRRRSCPAHP